MPTVIYLDAAPRRIATEGRDEVQVLDRTYCLLEQLGHGVGGSVWRAVNSSGLLCAVKRLKPDELEHADEIAAGAHEAAAHMTAAEGGTDNVVQLYNAFKLHRDFYIVMELCDGTLQQLMAREGFQPRAWFMKAADAILSALSWAHTSGGYHGDLHAGNVFYIGPGDPAMPDAHVLKVGDFGAAGRWWRDERDEDDPPGTANDALFAARVLQQLDPPPTARPIVERALRREFRGEDAALDFLLALRADDRAGAP